MSQGKYSPSLPNLDEDCFKFNCFKQIPDPWSQEIKEAGIEYNEKTMFAAYDSEGFDRYDQFASLSVSEFSLSRRLDSYRG